MKIIGIRYGDRTSKTTGNIYRAANVYLTFAGRNIDGLGCKEIFCKADSIDSDVSIGDEVNVLYNQYGKVDTIERA